MSQQINLFNPLFLKQKKSFSAANMAQALALVLFGSICVALYSDYQLKATASDAEQVSLQLQKAEGDLANLNAAAAARKPSASLQGEIERTKSTVTSMQQAFDTLQKGEMGNTKGYSEYFRAFSRQIVDGLWLTGVSLYGAGTEVGLRGPTSVPAPYRRQSVWCWYRGWSARTHDPAGIGRRVRQQAEARADHAGQVVCHAGNGNTNGDGRSQTRCHCRKAQAEAGEFHGVQLAFDRIRKRCIGSVGE